ncbi:MAG: hypothetical protein IJR44_00225 [Neisseriaceae bacterium]|nr:hypothetical protein [Neisseriaceae bacterium]
MRAKPQGVAWQSPNFGVWIVKSFRQAESISHAGDASLCRGSFRAGTTVILNEA